MKYLFFLDETGDHGLNYIDNNFPVFFLCGVKIREDCYPQIISSANSLKRKYFGSEEVIFHSRDIRKKDKEFAKLFNEEINLNFLQDLSCYIAESRFTILGSGVDKRKHIKKYGRVAYEPYGLALSFIIERLVFQCESLPDCDSIDVYIEMRGGKEDKVLLSKYNSIRSHGTYYVPAERIQKAISRFEFVQKKDNDIGIQLADLVAYPIARNYLNPAIESIPYAVCKDKIIRSSKKRNGVKFFP
jgi:hypothetical protein